MTAEPGVVGRLARFVTLLRERGLDVGPGDTVDAVEALVLVDLADVKEVRRTLRMALKIPRSHQPVFDRAFREFWLGQDGPSGAGEGPPRGERASREGGAGAGREWPLSGDPSAAAAERAASYSPEALLRRKPFGACTVAEVRALEPVLARLARRLATRRSRRYVPSRGRGMVDLRRSFRRAVPSGGEVLRPLRRKRAIELSHVVVLVDTSGSMDPYARFLVAFALALRRVARRTEVFAFNTDLTRLTPWLGASDPAGALDRLAARAPTWSRGTRIGASLARFAARYGESLVDGRTTVVVMSDGLDLGETDALRGAMQRIRRRARRVIWLNPLLGEPGYEPTARGMRAALPYVDRFLPGHNVESLERLLRAVD